ncbi:MAG: L-histidine N(alpha)-methyltransferase [Acidobacteria bacterium]|nr:L-histidine N(alpha)-methyltransferase [Acidobacteriota bacterium]
MIRRLTETGVIFAGLKAVPTHIPSKYFYDERGSKLFEQITRLEEYYPGRTEKAILARHAAELGHGCDGASFVEFGSGDCSRITILLSQLAPEMLGTVT